MEAGIGNESTQYSGISPPFGHTDRRFQIKKRAAHGDMSRSEGRGIEDLKKHSYRGDQNIYYHHVACQAFFSFFFKISEYGNIFTIG